MLFLEVFLLEAILKFEPIGLLGLFVKRKKILRNG